MQGMLSETFVLVDLRRVLLPGFAWCLERLKTISQSSDQMAFSPLIALDPTASTAPNHPPEYDAPGELEYNLTVLRKKKTISSSDEPLLLKPQIHFEDQKVQRQILDALDRETTLDEGQAVALCENLSRGLAFTQGPPGTGKTFLGVALTKALLTSRDTNRSRPVLVVCTTNHALDNFLDDLYKDGIDKLVRLGGGSKEPWTEQFQPRAISRRIKGPASAEKSWGFVKSQTEGRTSGVITITSR